MNDDLPPFCVFCFKCPDYTEHLIKLYRDVLGNYWCEEHKHIGKVIDWGSRQNWPLLNLKDGTVGTNSDEVAVIPAGAYWWYVCLVANRNIEIGYLAEGAIDFLDSQQEQAS